ncbi:hypothetical protein Tco_0845194 [Tanacetum coccineum]
MHVQENIVKEVEPIATEKNDVDEFVDSGIQSLVDVTLEELNEPADESPFDTKSEIKLGIMLIGSWNHYLHQTSETEEEDNQSQHHELSKSEDMDADNVIDELTDMVADNLEDYIPVLEAEHKRTLLRSNLKASESIPHIIGAEQCFEKRWDHPSVKRLEREWRRFGEEQQPKNNETEEAKQNQTIEQTPPISEDPPTTEKVPPVLTALMVLPFEIKTSEETPTEDEPLLKRQRIFDPDPTCTLTASDSYIHLH